MSLEIPQQKDEKLLATEAVKNETTKALTTLNKEVKVENEATKAMATLNKEVKVEDEATKAMATLNKEINQPKNKVEKKVDKEKQEVQRLKDIEDFSKKINEFADSKGRNTLSKDKTFGLRVSSHIGDLGGGMQLDYYKIEGKTEKLIMTYNLDKVNTIEAIKGKKNSLPGHSTSIQIKIGNETMKYTHLEEQKKKTYENYDLMPKAKKYFQEMQKTFK